MIKAFRQFREDIQTIITTLKESYSLLKDLHEKQNRNFDNNLITLARHQLGSIDLSDIPSIKPMTPDERKNYIARVSSAHTVIAPKIKKYIESQKDFMAREALNESQFLFARGTINGLYLILDEIEKENKEHLQSTRPPESFDPHKPFAEL